MKKTFENVLGNAITGKISDDKIIRDQITIREDFKNLIQPLTQQEFEQLESNILSEQVRDPLIIWQTQSAYILIDGHNRFRVCKEHNLEFPFKLVQFENEEKAKDWMINNQLGRRNLSAVQQSYLRGLKYNSQKVQGKRTDLTLDQNDLKSLSTAASLAKEYNVGEATIKRDGEFAKAVDKIGAPNPDLKSEILAGKSKLKRKQVMELAGSPVSKTPDGLQPKKAVTTGKRIAEIAIEYIKTEKCSIEEVGGTLGLELDKIEPVKFFMMWNASRNAQR